MVLDLATHMTLSEAVSLSLDILPGFQVPFEKKVSYLPDVGCKALDSPHVFLKGA